MQVADTLSRAAVENTDAEIPEDEMDFYVNSVISSLPISEKKMDQFRSETEKDSTMKKVKEYVTNGWSEDDDMLIAPYRNIRDELSCINGVLLKGNRIIVPPSMRKEVMSAIHSGHLGITKCENRAKVSVY